MNRRLGLLALATAFAVLTGCSRQAAPQRSFGPHPSPGAAVPTTSQVEASLAKSGAGIESSVPPSAAATTPVAPVLVFHGDPKVRAVALTFDLCEVPSKPAGFDRKLVDELIAAKAPATFMMGGHWAETHPSAARLLGRVPYFEIGDHSYAHKHPLRISAEDFRQEIRRAQLAIRAYSGRTPRIFRFPYGEHDEATIREVAGEGLVPVQWSVETGDPDPNVKAPAILAEVKRSARPGAIIIMHANGRGWHSAEALPKVIAWLRGHGYELVTVSELLGSK